MVDDGVWKRRFLVLTLVRLMGVLLIALGAAVAITDLVRPGGQHLLGAILIVVGTVDSAFAPMILKAAWKPPE